MLHAVIIIKLIFIFPDGSVHKLREQQFADFVPLTPSALRYTVQIIVVSAISVAANPTTLAFDVIRSHVINGHLDTPWPQMTHRNSFLERVFRISI